MHIVDLDLLTYHSGPFDANNWSVPLRAIGWIEEPHAFSQGTTTSEVVEKLNAMVKQVRAAYSQYSFRGTKHCTICMAADLPSPGPIWSQENIFVPGIETVYVCPGGIAHYIELHHYLPPADFLEAVLRCPDLTTVEYQELLRTTNRNINPPLETYESCISKARRKR